MKLSRPSPCGAPCELARNFSRSPIGPTCRTRTDWPRHVCFARRDIWKTTRSCSPPRGHRRNSTQPQQELPGLARRPQYLDLYEQPRRASLPVRLPKWSLAIRRAGRDPAFLWPDRSRVRPLRANRGIAALLPNGPRAIRLGNAPGLRRDQGSLSKYALLSDPATASCVPSGLKASPYVIVLGATR